MYERLKTFKRKVYRLFIISFFVDVKPSLDIILVKYIPELNSITEIGDLNLDHHL